MSFTITYKPLFEIRLLHHYHLDRGGAGNDYRLFDLAPPEEQEAMLRRYKIADFMVIEPTPACSALLRKHQCVFRRLDDGIMIAAKVVWDDVLGKYKPAVTIADDLVFTFRYRVTDAGFLNYTSLPLQRPADTLFFFRNRKEGSARTYPALSKLPPVRDNARVYDAGEILMTPDLSGVQIAGTVTGPANTPSQTFTADPQVAGSPLAYSNRNDLVKTCGNLFLADTGLLDRKDHVTATVTNAAGVVVTPRITITEDTHTKVAIDFSPFEEGLYRIQLEDAGSAYAEDIPVFVQKGNGDSDGIIQIGIRSDDTSFNVLNLNGTIKEGNQMKRFLLRFKNRATLWRYRGGRFNNMPESGPHLLARDGFVSLTINDENNDPVVDPPNASVNMIQTERPVAAPERYNLISEIYINS